MSENKLEKFFSAVLENWLSLTLIAVDEKEDKHVRYGSGVAAEVLNDILKECGFINDASDFFLERQQLQLDTVKGESA